MSVTVLFDAPRANWTAFERPLRDALNEAGIEAQLNTKAEPDTVDYVVYAPGGGITDFAPYTNTRAVLSLWAGVEKIVINPTLTQPLARMVDPGMTEGMTRMGCRPRYAPSSGHGRASDSQGGQLESDRTTPGAPSACRGVGASARWDQPPRKRWRR